MRTSNQSSRMLNSWSCGTKQGDPIRTIAMKIIIKKTEKIYIIAMGLWLRAVGSDYFFFFWGYQNILVTNSQALPDCQK